MTKNIMMGLLSLCLGGQLGIGFKSFAQRQDTQSVKLNTLTDPDGDIIAQQWDKDGQLNVFLMGLEPGIEERYVITEGQVPNWESLAVAELELLYPVELESEEISDYLQRSEVLLCGIDEAVVDTVIRDGTLTYRYSNWKGLQPKFGDPENWLYLVDEVLNVSLGDETCDLFINEHVFKNDPLDESNPIYLGVRAIALPETSSDEDPNGRNEVLSELN